MNVRLAAARIGNSLTASGPVNNLRYMGDWADIAVAALLVSLRLAPTLAFAQPFTLLRIPISVRVLLAIGLSLWLVDAHPALTVARLADRSVVDLIIGELGIGLSIALALQLAFAGVTWVGRVLDVQAGFGLAALADPTTSEELPLAGTVLLYAMGIIFFATGGQYDLLSLWLASIEALPLGPGLLRADVLALGGLMSSVFAVATGLVGIAVLALFLSDVVIALMSRTLPQMNVLLLGFQVKAMLLIVMLPVVLAFSSALFLRLIRLGMAAPAQLWSSG